MKKHFMIIAAVAAGFGLMSMTGCEKKSAEEPVNLSIEKQWIANVTPSEEEAGMGIEWNRYIFDINVTAENTVKIGNLNSVYAEMLPSMFEGFNADTDFMPQYDLTDMTVTKTTETSGTITGTSNLTGAEETIEYSELTENSVVITFSGQTLNCTAADKTMNFIDLGF